MVLFGGVLAYQPRPEAGAVRSRGRLSRVVGFVRVMLDGACGNTRGFQIGNGELGMGRGVEDGNDRFAVHGMISSGVFTAPPGSAALDVPVAGVRCTTTSCRRNVTVSR